MKKIVVCGSTGSIGRQTLEVCQWFPSELQVAALTGGGNVQLLADQVKKFHPQAVALADESKYAEIKELLAGEKVEILVGEAGVCQAAAWPGADLQVAAISGLAGLKPTLCGIEAGLDIAFANKEVLVAGGELVMRRVRERNVGFFPVDSEHSAIWQCLDGRGKPEALVLTCSGGALKNKTAAEIYNATPAETLHHPTWQMGAKITVDSATLMNKGLEIIEAHWLFDMPYAKISVVIHPESIIHSMVQYADGSLLAQMSYPDMRLPIQFALFYPERRVNPLKPLDFSTLGQLTFCQPDDVRFPCLKLAREAGEAGGTMPAVLSGANEVLNAAFLSGQISLGQIYDGVAAVLERYENTPAASLDNIAAADSLARREAALWLQKHAGKN
ncbi:MAG TPA: 1-deoxy-D-xylulose-5-phosphate reductoisomerase [Candidatus Avidehalobacter gallistercoris]|uniref:1-deoxy-D-xylulose 5-phosphate reductoisomerase n=1 Tax=Candidatus Avidehalobacter gallistercoris TaxID=2840694 RepID=A0A9D1HJT3_9FIRM|nr:1-deoxy-D-xylulose-5-phosphate reductoisomerase [Candidatus Avidehalobacter gallistercoris]